MRFLNAFLGDKQKSSSLERAKSPHLSISIPAQDSSSSDLVQPRRRTSKSGQDSNQERPRSALSPLYSPPYSTTVTGLRRPVEDEEEDFDDKISLDSPLLGFTKQYSPNHKTSLLAVVCVMVLIIDSDR